MVINSMQWFIVTMSFITVSIFHECLCAWFCKPDRFRHIFPSGFCLHENQLQDIAILGQMKNVSSLGPSFSVIYPDCKMIFDVANI